MLKKWKKQVLYRFRTLTSRYAEISQDSSIENRQTNPKNSLIRTPVAKKNSKALGVQGRFGIKKALPYQKPQAKAPEFSLR